MFKYKTISEDSSSDYSFIQTSFAVLGIYFPNQKSDGLAKFNLKFLCETAFSFVHTFCAIWIVCISFSPDGFPSIPLKVVFVLSHINLLLIRILLFLKRRRVAHLLRILEPHLPARCTVFLSCIASLLFPFLIVLFLNTAFITNYETAINMHKEMHLFVKSEPITVLVRAISNYFYFFHCYALPAMLTTLLSAVYLAFVSAYKEGVGHVAHQALLTQDATTTKLADAVEAFNSLSKIHQDIEESLSLSAFLFYALAFGYILVSIGCYLTGFYAGGPATILVSFAWPAMGIVLLTVCGSRISDVTPFAEMRIDAVVSANLRGKGRDELPFVLLLKEYARRELHFTAWGMFNVQKGLLLNTAGILIS